VLGSSRFRYEVGLVCPLQIFLILYNYRFVCVYVRNIVELVLMIYVCMFAIHTNGFSFGIFEVG
jgi:hypothetical protein